jgi:hypothetical protein
MIRMSIRIWAGILAIALPAFAIALDNNAGSNANGTTNTPDTAASTAAAPANGATPAPGINPAGDPLLRLMVSQGILGADDVAKLAGVPSAELRDRLLLLLLTKNKSTLSTEDVSALAASGASGNASGAVANKDDEQPSGPPQVPAQAPPAGPIPAVAPIRVLQIDPPRREGVIPILSVGKGVHIQPYGLFKASAVYDTSSPYGNDFPLPGFNPVINGPGNLSEFHVKARFLRFGSNFEWMDSPHLVLTGKVEADFEGNFSTVNNRNISAIRSNALQLRQAYVRMDYKPNDNNSVFALFGQDWTPFGSSTLPNIFETTGLGVGFGTLYERDPQFRFGMEHNFGSFKLGPEIAVVLPAFGNVPGTATAATLQNQLGFGERQGVDYGAPEIQGRLVGQFQLDHAPGVAPAQLIISGVHSHRDQIVTASGVPAGFTTFFPKGANVTTQRNALTGEVQLPTRWFTLVGKYYNGTDLRYYFSGEIYSPVSVTKGLTSVASGTTIDGSGPAVFFGCAGGGAAPTCLGGTGVVAPQLAPRSWGGFLNLGLPLSRWFNADPSGRNAGWQLYAHYGWDQVRTADVIAEGGGRAKGRLVAGTLFYKLNNFVSFGWEESLYTTVAIPLNATGQFPVINGRPQREWNDFRSEIGPLFTF